MVLFMVCSYSFFVIRRPKFEREIILELQPNRACVRVHLGLWCSTSLRTSIDLTVRRSGSLQISHTHNPVWHFIHSYLFRVKERCSIYTVMSPEPRLKNERLSRQKINIKSSTNQHMKLAGKSSGEEIRAMSRNLLRIIHLKYEMMIAMVPCFRSESDSCSTKSSCGPMHELYMRKHSISYCYPIKC